jgi:hypothetical protein
LTVDSRSAFRPRQQILSSLLLFAPFVPFAAIPFFVIFAFFCGYSRFLSDTKYGV